MLFTAFSSGISQEKNASPEVPREIPEEKEISQPSEIKTNETDIQKIQNHENNKSSNKKSNNSYKPFSINFSTSAGITSITDSRRLPAETENHFERSLMIAGSITPGLEQFSQYMLYKKEEFPRPAVRGFVNHSRFYIEYRPRKFGLSAGMTSANYSFKEKENPLDHNYYLLILNAQTSNPILLNPIIQYVEFNREKDRENNKTSFNFNMFEFSLSYHFLPSKKWDPYLNTGIKFGGCKNNCGAAGAFIEGGFRYNFKYLHVNTGIYHQGIVARKFNRKAHYRDTGVLIGVGLHL